MTEPSRAVFLSYASQDAEAAARLCASLRAAGIEVWFDQSELRGGDAWDLQITKQIRECALFVALISAHTDARSEGYFRREWRIAVDRTRDMADDQPYLLPVVVDGTSNATSRVPNKFREVQWTQLPGGEAPPAFVQRIVRLLAQDTQISEAIVAFRSAPASKQPAPAWPPRLALLLMVTALAAIGYFAFDRFVLSKRSPGTDREAARAVQTKPSSPSAIPDKSIAVLPFADMSEKHDQEYFSDGLAEELIEMLTKVPDLLVPARTSSFYFKGKQTTIGEVAKALGVAHVLEGSVRKSGNTLRVTAQLIRTDNGYLLWSESYDRELKDVFKVQDDIAGNVVQVLKATLLTHELDSGTARIGPETYNLYLKARFTERQGTPEGVKAAIDRYKEVVAAQPTYGVAWAELSHLYEIQANTFTIPGATAYAREAAARALTADPLLPAAHVAMGNIYKDYDWDWASADTEFKRALELNPNDQSALLGYGNFAKMMGRRTEAVEILKRSVERDPLRAGPHAYFGWALWLQGRLDEAEFEYRKTLELAPQAFLFHSYLGRIILERGRREEALAEIQKEPQAEARMQALATVYYTMGNRKESDRLVAELVKTYGEVPGNQVNIAAAYAERGEIDRAFGWLQRGYAERDAGITGLLENPYLKNLSGDPRYKVFLRKMKLPE